MGEVQRVERILEGVPKKWIDLEFIVLTSLGISQGANFYHLSMIFYHLVGNLYMDLQMDSTNSSLVPPIA